eukprot:gene22462-23634_t
MLLEFDSGLFSIARTGTHEIDSHRAVCGAALRRSRACGNPLPTRPPETTTDILIDQRLRGDDGEGRKGPILGRKGSSLETRDLAGFFWASGCYDFPVFKLALQYAVAWATGFHQHSTFARRERDDRSQKPTVAIGRQSGRPEPHRSWAMISFYMWICAVAAVTFCAMAGYYVMRWGLYDAVPTILWIALFFAAIALLLRRFLVSRQRSLALATARYESALKVVLLHSLAPQNQQ